MIDTSSKNQVASSKIKAFTDLVAWEKGHGLVLNIYKITAHFPQSEQFGLTSQMRRAAVSITSNIAEGFSRRTINDKKHFYQMSLGSLTELQNQLIIARDLGYFAEYEVIEVSSVELHKIINGLIKSLRENN